MKRQTIMASIATGAAVLVTACASQQATTRNDDVQETENVFLTVNPEKYEIPQFGKIKYDHYLPAIEAGIKEHNDEILNIVRNRARPDFENTILALDNSGQQLEKVTAVMGGLASSDNTDELQKIMEQAQPMLTAHGDEVGMNELLFRRIKDVYDNKEIYHLNTAQERLLNKYYKKFVRSGALLDSVSKDTLRQINQDIAAAQLSFRTNLLKATNATEIVVSDKAELDGLDAATIENAATEAKSRGKEGQWVLTVHAPSRLAVLTYANNRGLREKMYKAYTSLCSDGGEYDNSENINTILRLRQKKAQMLGFGNYADFQMDNVMAKTTEAAEKLLYQVWTPALEKAKEEVRDMQALADEEKAGITIEPWDYYYYAEKVKTKRFNLSESDVRPYFVLDNVVNDGIFYIAKRLYGITFTEMPDAPKYNPEVKVYDVKDADGKHVAVFMTDYFPRATKAQGAWMSEFKGEYNYNGANERPIIYNVCNFTKPTKDMPSLLTLDEVETAFHEFGHGLQGMLTTAEYRSQSGTNVDRNFVEFASQIDEHWAMEPEVLRNYARHYKTGEVIPDSLIQKLDASGKFNQGFATVEYCAASILDLEWHKLQMTDANVDIREFERQVAEKIGLPHEITYRYRSPYFKHIFGSNGYAAGYYTYLWAEVLDTDGFELFKERGIFDPETAKSYKENILETGDSEDPMKLYVRFRGREPQVDALLRHRGLK